MTTRYVGSGGSNSNDGLSWANRKLTLNGVEDTPVVAGDLVYVGPGVYRETLTVDVSGSDGSPITYIGDVTGEHTDGVGGVVRITGSDDDITRTRQYCVSVNAKNYRTFRGFCADASTLGHFYFFNGSSNCIVEYCSLWYSGSVQINISGTGVGFKIRNCYFDKSSSHSISISHTVTVDNTGNEITNCIFATSVRAIQVDRVGGITIKNCTFIGNTGCVRVQNNPASGQTITLNNSIMYNSTLAVYAPATGYLIENYNAFYGNATDRSGVDTGANSNSYPPIFEYLLPFSGTILPQPLVGKLSKYSLIARIAGSSEASDDFYGSTRPATSSKKSWGAVQATGAIRETTTIDGASGASIKLPDAGEQFIMRIPVTNLSTTIGLKVYREANYAGTNPSMIIRQPGQSDRVTTDTGNASQWNSLSDTFTPAANPGYIDIFFRSSNTATSGNYDAFCDTLTVS